jgi:predicted nucleic acid-binding protein
MAPERGVVALADLADMPLRRYAHDFLLPSVWALRHNLIAYDAVYVALAEALDARASDARPAYGRGSRPSCTDRTV